MRVQKKVFITVGLPKEFEDAEPVITYRDPRVDNTVELELHPQGCGIFATMSDGEKLDLGSLSEETFCCLSHSREVLFLRRAQEGFVGRPVPVNVV